MTTKQHAPSWRELKEMTERIEKLELSYAELRIRDLEVAYAALGAESDGLLAETRSLLAKTKEQNDEND